jgi:hypothetical protein
MNPWLFRLWKPAGRLRVAAIALTAVLVGILPDQARAEAAGELAELKASVHVMEQAIQDLKTRIAALEQQTSTPCTQSPITCDSAAVGPALVAQRDSTPTGLQAAKRLEPAPVDSSYKGFMQLPGTRTGIKFGGYAKVDMIADTTKLTTPNWFATSGIPVEGEATYGKGEQFTIIAKQSRLSLELKSAVTASDSLKIYAESDFFANSAQPSMDFRLRHLYGQFRNFTAGQTSTVFYDPDVVPDTLDFEGPATAGANRSAQVRFTLPLVSAAQRLAVSMEQPQGDLSHLPPAATVRNVMPDIATHWRWEGPLGHLQLGGIVRALSCETTSGGGQTEVGWGGNLSGALKTTGQDILMADFIYGDGIGRFIQDLPSGSAGIVDATGRLKTITAWTGMLSYRHQWGPQWRSIATYGYTEMESPAELGGFAYENAHYFQANWIWSPVADLSIGLEYLYGIRTVRSGSTGDDQRLQLSIRYQLFR